MAMKILGMYWVTPKNDVCMKSYGGRMNFGDLSSPKGVRISRIYGREKTINKLPRDKKAHDFDLSFLEEEFTRH